MRLRLWSARHAKPMDAGMWPGCWISLIPTWSGLISILRSRILSPRRVTAGSSSGGRWNVRLSGAWRRRSRKSWHRALDQAAPLRPLPDGITDLDHFRVRRHDRAGGVIHEYRLVA